MTLKERLDKIVRLAEKATAGPWRVEEWGDYRNRQTGFANVVCDSAEQVLVPDALTEDAEFIASIHDLLQLAKEQQEVIDELSRSLPFLTAAQDREEG